MSFQAYLDNVKAKTGKTPEELRALAEKAGVFSAALRPAIPAPITTASGGVFAAAATTIAVKHTIANARIIRPLYTCG